MKKLLVLAASAGLVFGAGAAIAVASNTPAVETHAADVSDAEIDVSGLTHWQASAGKFIKISNWYNSGLGLSFEFKVKDVNNVKRQVFKLYGNDKDLSGNIYLMDVSTADGNTIDSIPLNRTPGKLEIVDKAAGWLRYEVMFANISPVAANASNPIDRLSFVWGDTPQVSTIRNVQIIGDSRVKGDTPLAYSSFNSAGYLRGLYNEFPEIDNWYTSGKGFSFEFKPDATRNVNTLFTLLDRNWTALGTGNWYMYKDKNASAPTIGKTSTLADGWYRYELMCADVPLGSSDGTAKLSMFCFTKWEASGYNCRPEVRNVKEISAYSETYEAEVDNYASSLLSKTGAVCVADGSTDQTALASAVAECKTAYDALTPQAKVLDTYSDKIVATAKRTNVDNANSRLSYIVGKYPSIANYTPILMGSANATSFLFGNDVSNSETYATVAIGAVSLITAGGLIFARKKHN